MLRGVSKKAVGEYLEQRLGASAVGRSGSSVVGGRRVAGWYFQQLVKLGAARRIEGLAPLFLLWDMDMVPLRPLSLFAPRPEGSAKPKLATGASTPSPLRTHRMVLGICLLYTSPSPRDS